MISEAGLTDRGWTKNLKRKFAPLPSVFLNDKFWLYDLSMIISIEKSPEFISAVQKLEAKRIASKQAINTKIQKGLDNVRNIELPPLNKPIELIYKQAVDSYNSQGIWAEQCGYKQFDLVDLQGTKQLKVITIRHLQTELQAIINSSFSTNGITGKGELDSAINRLISDHILATYPELTSVYEWMTNVK